MPKSIRRCTWCGTDPVYVAYHDEEWGVPLHDDVRLFEALCLDGAQAGLSWITILKKRENYRKAFAGFDAQKMARFGEKQVAKLMQNSGIVRNELKIRAFISNAKAYLALRESGTTLDAFLWQFVDGRTLHNRWRSMDEVPAETPMSKDMSRELKKLGFRFVGPTICYAMMQAVGIVNDHTTDCFRYRELTAAKSPNG